MNFLSSIQEWLRRCYYLVRRASFERQMNQETEFHIILRCSELVAAGRSPADALLQARKEFGPVLRAQEDSREAWHFQGLEQTFVDSHYAFRQMMKAPASTLISILSLALGIGATTAVFSVLYGVLLHPFPYVGADRMVTFNVTAGTYNRFSGYCLLSARQFEDFKKSPVLDGVIATDSWDMAVTGEELPEAVHAGKLSANAFQYFGVPPILGREFSSDEGAFGQEPQKVVVLSYHFWQGHYGGGPDVIGKTLQLDRENYTIIGVAPRQFAWFQSDVYIPIRLSNDPDRVAIINARLKPGVTPQSAEASLTPLLHAFKRETPTRIFLANLGYALRGSMPRRNTSIKVHSSRFLRL